MSRHFKKHPCRKINSCSNWTRKVYCSCSLKIKIDPTNEEATTEIVQWGSDNLYPQNFYNKKISKNGAAVGGISI
jgi:hypothetical protein